MLPGSTATATKPPIEAAVRSGTTARRPAGTLALDLDLDLDRTDNDRLVAVTLPATLLAGIYAADIRFVDFYRAGDPVTFGPSHRRRNSCSMTKSVS